MNATVNLEVNGRQAKKMLKDLQDETAKFKVELQKAEKFFKIKV